MHSKVFRICCAPCVIVAISFFFVPRMASGEERSFSINLIQGNNNSFDIVESELNQLVSLLASTNSKAIIKLNVRTDFGVAVTTDAKISISGILKGAPDGIRAAMERYAALRLGGHSKAYALYLILHGDDKWPPTLRQYLIVPNVSKEIAYPWIRLNINETTAFWWYAKSKNNNFIYVVDGELTWIYTIPKYNVKANSDVPLVVHRMESIELDPAIAHLFQLDFAEVKRLHPKHLQNEPSLAVVWWAELKRKLKSESGIIWRTPIELNPDDNFD